MCRAFLPNASSPGSRSSAAARPADARSSFVVVSVRSAICPRRFRARIISAAKLTPRLESMATIIRTVVSVVIGRRPCLDRVALEERHATLALPASMRMGVFVFVLVRRLWLGFGFQGRIRDRRPGSARDKRGMGGVVNLAERGRPARTATRAQSSCSGLKVGGRPSIQPSFPFTGPNRVATSVACRRSLCRLTGYLRTPSVVVSRKRISSMSPILGSSQITETMTPGRFFFIWTGVTNASSAPAAMSCVVA